MFVLKKLARFPELFCHKTPIILSQQHRSFGPRATAFRLSSGRISNSVPHVKPHDFWDHEKIPACTQRTWLGKNSNFDAPQQLDSSGLCRATSVPKTKNSAFDSKDVEKMASKNSMDNWGRPVLLMVQKSQGQPPGIYTPCK